MGRHAIAAFLDALIGGHVKRGMEKAGEECLAFETMVCDAIQAGRLHQLCIEKLNTQEIKAHPERKAQLQNYQATCERIADQIRVKRDAVLAGLQDRGVALEDLSMPPIAPIQFHSFTLDVAQADLPGALQAASDAGFHVDDVLLRRAVTLGRARGWIDLLAWDDASFRLRLAWRTTPRALRKLAADPVDVTLIDLPAALTWGYAAVRPMRKIYEAMSGQKTEDRIGLRAGHMSLGTPMALIDALLAETPLKADHTLMDLGCGDGRVLVRAAEVMGCKGIGVERNARLVAVAKENAQTNGVASKLSFLSGDISDAPVQEADVIFLFLPPRLLSAVLNDLHKRARPGTLIIAHEQQKLKTDWEPMIRRPIVSENAITVAHLWQV